MHDGTIVKTNAEDGTCDICFRFNPNVIEHGIPVGKLERKLTMDPALAPKRKALDKIMKHPDSKDFLKPVLSLWPPEAIPGYTDIIKRPMVRCLWISSRQEANYVEYANFSMVFVAESLRTCLRTWAQSKVTSPAACTMESLTKCSRTWSWSSKTARLTQAMIKPQSMFQRAFAYVVSLHCPQ